MRYDDFRSRVMSANPDVTDVLFKKFFKYYSGVYIVLTLNALAVLYHLSRGSGLLTGAGLVLMVVLFMSDCAWLAEDSNHFNLISKMVSKRWKLVIILACVLDLVIHLVV